MAEVPSNLDKMLEEEVDFLSPDSEQYQTKIAANINGLIDGRELFTLTGSGTFVTPERDPGSVIWLAVFGAGGGGGGGGGGARNTAQASGGGGGGAGAEPFMYILPVSPNENISYSVGIGGLGGAPGAFNVNPGTGAGDGGAGGQGGTTTFGTISWPGGAGGTGGDGSAVLPNSTAPGGNNGVSTLELRRKHIGGGQGGNNAGPATTGNGAAGQLSAYQFTASTGGLSNGVNNGGGGGGGGAGIGAGGNGGNGGTGSVANSVGGSPGGLTAGGGGGGGAGQFVTIASPGGAGGDGYLQVVVIN